MRTAISQRLNEADGGGLRRAASANDAKDWMQKIDKARKRVLATSSELLTSLG